MNTRNILTTKFPKMNINKQNAFKVSKILPGLIALSVCLKTGYGCYQHSNQQKQDAARHDQTTMATLIDKKVIEGDDNTNQIIFWLDTDNDLGTAEGHCSIPDASHKKASNIAGITNGTTKSLAEWRRIASPHEVQHNPSTFLSAR